MRRRTRTTAWIALLIAATASTAACSGDRPNTQTVPTTGTPSATASTGAGVDPQAQAAVDAYLKLEAAIHEAERRPRRPGQAVDPAADYSRYSFDPVRGQESAYLVSLALRGLVRRGTPPTPHPQVSSVDLGAKPYPTVVLTNCSSPSPSWGTFYDAKTGKAVPDPYAGVPPVTTSIQVILSQGHWGVSKIDHLKDKPCAG